MAGVSFTDTDTDMTLLETYNLIAKDWHEQSMPDDWWIEGTNSFISLLPKGASVLDVGCAGGVKTQYLVERELNVTGIDFSENMIKIAKERVPQANFLVYDMNAMDSFEGMYDGIYLSAVILHVPKDQIVALLRKIVKHLKDGGYLYIAVKEKREHEPEEEIKVENELGYTYERFFSYFLVDEVIQYLNIAGLHMTTAILTTAGRRNWIQVIGKKGND